MLMAGRRASMHYRTTCNVIGRELPALEMVRGPASLLNVLFHGEARPITHEYNNE